MVFVCVEDTLQGGYFLKSPAGINRHYCIDLNGAQFVCMSILVLPVLCVTTGDTP